jgi:hypothetical protein
LENEEDDGILERDGLLLVQDGGESMNAIDESKAVRRVPCQVPLPSPCPKCLHALAVMRGGRVRDGETTPRLSGSFETRESVHVFRV